ncbi:MAG: hypothetical protein Q8N26_16400 [Myxococcales bacterium]|nr:hypothetical protein [Myxococcales bacterium]
MSVAAVTLSLLLTQSATKAPAHQVLLDQCLLHAADPKNPWALAHGITAYGGNFLANDGRKATDAITKDFLNQNLLPDGGVGAGNTYGFLRYGADKTPIEPHTNLVTKTFVLAKLPMTTTFPTRWGQVTLQQLVDSVKKGFRHVPSNAEYWRDSAWTIDLLSAVGKPGTTIPTELGPVSLDLVMDDALTALEKDQAELTEGMKKGLPEVPKRKQGIYAHSCGGLHLLQAVFGWSRFPEVKKKWGARLDAQIAVLFYRLESERRQYDAALQQAPQFTLQILTQQVKFYGHFLESVGRLKNEAGFKPNKEQQLAVNKAKVLLDAAVKGLEGIKAFSTMSAIKQSNPQVYLDLIGDSCHAANGWNQWQ